jgi:sulfotransferase family protein
VAAARTDAVIAGVNKAGTTSLFVSLSAHPAVAASTIKETRYFLPPRYGRPLDPPSVWEAYFARSGDRAVRLEATPSYFYGGARVAAAMLGILTDPHVIVVLREPVARAISFFTYQKSRLRFPVELSIEDYLATADALGPEAFTDPENEKYMAFQGGCYADYLPEWLETLGTERVRVLDFDALVADEARVLSALAEWFGIDPTAFPRDALESENRTTGFKHASLQRVALAGNDRMERLFRRHPETKRRLRAFYYRLNGRPADERVSPAVRTELAKRYEEPNVRLAAQLRASDIPLPAWLAARV